MKVKESTQQRAKLRVCASCEWVFQITETEEGFVGGCPKCGFASYGAHYVYGDKCYRYAITQWPWMEKKMMYHQEMLSREIYHSSGYTKAKQKLQRKQYEILTLS